MSGKLYAKSTMRTGHTASVTAEDAPQSTIGTGRKNGMQRIPTREDMASPRRLARATGHAGPGGARVQSLGLAYFFPREGRPAPGRSAESLHAQPWETTATRRSLMAKQPLVGTIIGVFDGALDGLPARLVRRRKLGYTVEL